MLFSKAQCDINNPCQNGGTCMNIQTLPYYQCKCPVGYSGFLCKFQSTSKKSYYNLYFNLRKTSIKRKVW